MPGLAALLALPALLAAPGPPLALEITAPPDAGCPPTSALRARVAASLGRDPFAPDAPRRMRVRVIPEGEGLRADLRLTDAASPVGERTLRVPVRDCAELFGAVALNLVLLAEPARALAPPPPEPALDAPPAADPPPTPDPPTSPRPDVDRGAEAWLSLGLGLGAVPFPTAAFGLGLGWRADAWTAGLELHYQPPTRRDFREGEVQADLLAGGLTGCLRWRRFAGCGLVLAGDQRAGSAGFARTGDVRTPFLAAGARGAVEWAPWPAWRLRVQGDLWGAVSQTTLRIDGDVAWSNPPVGGGVSLAVGRVF